MKILGLLILLVGMVWAGIAFNLNTTVEGGGQTFGTGEYSFQTPKVTVNNLGLMEARRNQLMFSGLAVLIGALFVGFGSLTSKSSVASPEAFLCPKCSGKNVLGDQTCRYCRAELPSQESPATIVPGTLTVAEQIERLAALRQQGAISEAEFAEAKRKALG